MERLKLYMVGAGGVASYFLPIVNRVFDISGSTIIDADILETKNLDRQVFNQKDVGKPKVEAILKHHKIKKVKGIVSWFEPGMLFPDGTDMVICMADNHPARRAVIMEARESATPCFIGGNEYFDSQAIMYLPWVEESNPLYRYEEMATSDEGSPIRCTGDEQESSPQLAIANMRAATQLMDLIWLYKTTKPKDQDYCPADVYRSKWGTTIKSIQNLKQNEQNI